MKNTLRILSVALVAVLCFGLFVACDNAGAESTQKPAETQPTVTTVPTGTEPFVAPPDALGKVVSADTSLITWNAYETSDETIDFMGIKVKDLGKPSAEMSLFYLEKEVTYYKVAEGKLNPATYEDVVPNSIIGITTLEEGVQEVYIVYAPVEDDGSDEYDDTVEEVIDETVTTTAAIEEATPDDGGVATDAIDEPAEDPIESEPVYEEPSLDETTDGTAG